MKLSVTPLQKRLKTLGLIVWILLWPLVLAAIFYPIKDLSLRLFTVVGLLSLWTGALVLCWKRPRLCLLCVLFAVVPGLALLLPGRQRNHADLRQEYVRSLTRYEGTTYMWGGESRRGMDCSGLIRRGLMDADFKVGLRTANAGLVREALDLWWHDCSARAMKEEYRQKTRLLLTALSLNQVNYAVLREGDIAVTSNAVHTLAYIGDKTWIEADPGAWRVIKVQVPSKNAWFSMPVHIMRWRQFEPR